MRPHPRFTFISGPAACSCGRESPLPAPPLSKVLGNLPSRTKEASATDRKRGVSPATPQTWDVLSSSHAASPMTIVFRSDQGVRLPQRLLLPLLAEPCSG